MIEDSKKDFWDQTLAHVSLDEKEYILESLRSRGKWKFITHHGRRYRKCSRCNIEIEDNEFLRWDICFYCESRMY